MAQHQKVLIHANNNKNIKTHQIISMCHSVNPNECGSINIYHVIYRKYASVFVCVCGCYLITGLYSDKTSQITCLSTVCLSFCSNWHEINHQSSTFLALCEGKPQVTDGLPSQRAEKVESVPMSWRVMAYIHPTQQVSKTRNTKSYPSSGRQERALADGSKITRWPSGKSSEPPGAIHTTYATDALIPPGDN